MSKMKAAKTEKHVEGVALEELERNIALWEEDELAGVPNSFGDGIKTRLQCSGCRRYTVGRYWIAWALSIYAWGLPHDVPRSKLDHASNRRVWHRGGYEQKV